jgi:hypothetical protein
MSGRAAVAQFAYSQPGFNFNPVDRSGGDHGEEGKVEEEICEKEESRSGAQEEADEGREAKAGGQEKSKEGGAEAPGRREAEASTEEAGASHGRSDPSTSTNTNSGTCSGAIVDAPEFGFWRRRQQLTTSAPLGVTRCPAFAPASRYLCAGISLFRGALHRRGGANSIGAP